LAVAAPQHRFQDMPVQPVAQVEVEDLPEALAEPEQIITILVVFHQKPADLAELAVQQLLVILLLLG
jgi:hypothetical protein